MDHHHTFDFVEGTLTVPIAPGMFPLLGAAHCLAICLVCNFYSRSNLPSDHQRLLTDPPEIKEYYPDTDTCFGYFDPQSTISMRAALAQLAAYITLEGPYDGVLAYSHGAALAATYIIHQAQLHPTSPPPFKCAIFLSGGIPPDPAALDNHELRLLDPAKDGKPLKLSTAHIWGANDNLYPGTSAILSQLCDDEMRCMSIHEGGHDVPNARANEAVLDAAKAIRRTVDRALTAQ